MTTSPNDATIISFATAAMGILAWIGHTLNTANPLPSRARWIGGSITAGFVAYASIVLLMNTGMDPKVASVLSAICGSMGEKGLNFLWEKYYGKQ